MRGIPSAAPNRASPQNAISMPRHSPSHPAHCTHSVTKGSAVRPPACLPALIEKQVRNTHRPALYEILTIARRSNSARPPLKCNFQCKMRFFCNSQSNTSRGATMLMDLRRLCPPLPRKRDRRKRRIIPLTTFPATSGLSEIFYTWHAMCFVRRFLLPRQPRRLRGKSPK